MFVQDPHDFLVFHCPGFGNQKPFIGWLADHCGAFVISTQAPGGHSARQFRNQQAWKRNIVCSLMEISAFPWPAFLDPKHPKIWLMMDIWPNYLPRLLPDYQNQDYNFRLSSHGCLSVGDPSNIGLSKMTACLLSTAAQKYKYEINSHKYSLIQYGNVKVQVNECLKVHPWIVIKIYIYLEMDISSHSWVIFFTGGPASLADRTWIFLHACFYASELVSQWVMKQTTDNKRQIFRLFLLLSALWVDFFPAPSRDSGNS